MFYLGRVLENETESDGYTHDSFLLPVSVLSRDSAPVAACGTRRRRVHTPQSTAEPGQQTLRGHVFSALLKVSELNVESGGQEKSFCQQQHTLIRRRLDVDNQSSASATNLWQLNTKQ